MALLSTAGKPDVFSVTISSSDRNFVHYEMSEAEGMKISAKQLYPGKRYVLQRLLAGRIKDFWKENSEIAIRGKFVSIPPPNGFAIEPIEEGKLIEFWKNHVRQETPYPGPMELLISIGFLNE